MPDDTLEQLISAIDRKADLALSHARRLKRQVDDLAARLDIHFPPIFNCPKCRRKVHKDAHSCPICSHQW